MSKKTSSNSIGYRKPRYILSDDPRALTSDSLESFRSKSGAKIIVKNAPTNFMDLDEYTIPVIVYDYWFGSLWSPEDIEDGDPQGIEIDSSGNTYTVKKKPVGSGGLLYIILTKHDKNGNFMWSKKINSDSTTLGTDTNPVGLKIDYSDNIYVYANSTVVDTSVNYSRYVILKYDSTGTLLWKKQEQHNTTTGSKTWTEVRSLSIDSSNNVYLVGSRRINTTRYASLVIKYDSSGTILWQKVLVGGDSASGNQGWASTVDSSGNIYVITRYTPIITANGIQMIVTKINSSGSAITWQKILTGGLSAPYLAIKAKTDNADNIYILSFGGTGSTNTNYLTKYDSSGTRIWVKRFSNASNGNSDFNIDSNNNIYFVGGTILFSTTLKPTIVKTNSAGTLQWEKIIQQTSPINNNNLLTNIAIDNTRQKISILGRLGSTTGNISTLISDVPLDTDFAGTYVIPSNTYSVSSTLSVSTITHTVITDITGTTSSNAGLVLTAFAPALTDETSTFTDATISTYGWSYIGF